MTEIELLQVISDHGETIINCLKIIIGLFCAHISLGVAFRWLR